MVSTSTSIGLSALALFAICIVFNFADFGQELLADFREKREIRHFSNSDISTTRRKRSDEDEDQNIVILDKNPFTDVKDNSKDAKNADQFLLPGYPQPGFTSVHTRVVQPGSIPIHPHIPIHPVQPVLGHPEIVPAVPATGIIGESRRDRLRRILRKLLGEKKEVAVPVPVPIPVVPGEEVVGPSFEGSYVAVSGRPGERTVHVVNGRTGLEISGTITGEGRVSTRRRRPFIKADNNENFDYSPVDYNGDNNDYGDYGYDYNDVDGLVARRDPLGGDPGPRPGFLGRGRKRRIPPVPRCSYINTDFFGDDVGDGRGLTSASAEECKTTCQREEVCQFWTYRPGWARGCYLKRGRRGDPTPLNAIPKEGFISGTKLDTCVCLQNSVNGEEQVCPIKTTQYVYPWHRKRPNGYDGNVRFDYDDDEIRRRPVIDDGFVSVEPVTLPPPVGIGGVTRKTRARTRARLNEGVTTIAPVEEDLNKQVETFTPS